MIMVRKTLFQNLAMKPQILRWKILCHLQIIVNQYLHTGQCQIYLFFVQKIQTTLLFLLPREENHPQMHLMLSGPTFWQR